MISVRVRRVDNQLTKIKRQAKQLTGSKSQIGFFEEQGEHTSGFSYAQLMAVHEFAMGDIVEADIPDRPILQITAFENRPNRNLKTKKAIVKLIKNLGKRGNIKESLDVIGTEYQERIRAIFGDTTKLTENATFTINKKGSNTPMEDTGELKAHVARRSTSDKTIRT